MIHGLNMRAHAEPGRVRTCCRGHAGKCSNPLRRSKQVKIVEQCLAYVALFHPKSGALTLFCFLSYGTAGCVTTNNE